MYGNLYITHVRAKLTKARSLTKHDNACEKKHDMTLLQICKVV